MGSVIGVLLMMLVATTGCAKFSRTPRMADIWRSKSASAETQDPNWLSGENLIAISQGVGLYFSDGGGGLPATYPNLQSSGYLCVRAEDIVNPFTSQPVRSVSELSAGDVVWDYNESEGRLVLRMGILQEGQLVEVTVPYESAGKEFTPGFIRDEWQSVNERKVVSCAHTLDEWVFIYGTNQGGYPTDYSALVSTNPLTGKLWNPYETRYAVERALSDPVPGDFHYETCTVGGIVKYELAFFLPQGRTVGNGGCGSGPTW
jgi:hypothetical protein